MRAPKSSVASAPGGNKEREDGYPRLRQRRTQTGCPDAAGPSGRDVRSRPHGAEDQPRARGDRGRGAVRDLHSVALRRPPPLTPSRAVATKAAPREFRVATIELSV